MHNVATNEIRRKPRKEKAFSAVRDTSIDAFRSQDEETTAWRRNRICRFIDERGGATCWEVENALCLLHQSASSTITRLRTAGHLVDTGERRPTNTGRMATVWGAAP
jgi:hypothetical protein